MDYSLEVIGIPVSDVDAAIRFYVDQAGFHLDHDVSQSPGMRVVQLTPTGSPCSVVIGEGMPLGEPGTTKGMQLVVQDIDAARAELSDRREDLSRDAARARGNAGFPVRIFRGPRRERLVTSGNQAVDEFAGLSTAPDLERKPQCGPGR
ncbi:MAG TPA: VOC family protein [Microbacterium sp.]|nr:VOC family protein [Microbacterium sp.]